MNDLTEKWGEVAISKPMQIIDGLLAGNVRNAIYERLKDFKCFPKWGDEARLTRVREELKALDK